MKKTLIIIMLIFTIFCSIGVSLKLRQNNHESDNVIKENDKNINIEDEVYDSNEEGNVDKIDSNEKEDDIVIEEKSEEIIDKNENLSASEKKSNSTKESSKLPKKEQESTNKETGEKESQKNNNSSTSSVVKKEETAWEKLGISEYDYYNSPEISWKTIDFSIKEYGSFDKTKEACYNVGTSYTESESYRFRCYESYSYSGDFLGYHIEYIELES